MKSLIKRCLFIGITISLAALTARRMQGQIDVEGRLDPPPPDPTPDKIAASPRPGLPHGLPRPMSATTVTFSGTVVRNGPRFALRETAGILYPLDSAGRAWPFEGEDVRVTGHLDMSSRLLYVDAIEPCPL